ncbi:HTH-type transcriptional repressor YvoA [Tritonibacter multivorans]|jgi:DNA-binding GntR family transcriptional regulator|uniref:HTH-type transcriptional repressor YvoA n=1 Tax=Tritonibacter multivorans TaxID=928856 RepID=A0A0P1G066_9RHOB|nr:GntR family transcriptional regulator [Tritonibacter multivorans]MDA7423032.1 GntR family transcriptional regulator [Tritonibacter multivorans]CUH75039.1 HTH-type transcriptional repressor YvoA [Tritonibacter multivorans]SFD79585.1 transcriptional regulator, GntR family [Tritonibacter multivorans]
MTINEWTLKQLRDAVTNPAGAVAKYSRLETHLSQMIASRALLPGERLPVDKVFATQIGVSLGTVQKALVGLHKKGLVTRAPKRGTVVAERQVGEHDVYVFRFRDAETGDLLLPKVRTVSVTEIDETGAWSAFLGTDRIVCVERIMQISIEPPVYSQVFIAHEHGESLLNQHMDAFAGFSVHRHIESCHDAPTLRSESKVRLDKFEGRAAQQLTLPEGTPSLTWEVSSFTVGDRPASFQRIQIPPNHRPLEFRRAYGD